MSTSTPPVAAIDCGTNSIRLLIASLDEQGGLVEHARKLELARLGQGVDATGAFHPDALQRTFDACEKYRHLIEASGCDTIRFVATSAARDVSNRDEFPLQNRRIRHGPSSPVCWTTVRWTWPRPAP